MGLNEFVRYSAMPDAPVVFAKEDAPAIGCALCGSAENNVVAQLLGNEQSLILRDEQGP